MKNKILWKVYLIWFFRKIVPLMVFQAIVFGIALKIFANNVFVGQVFANAGVAANSGYIEFFKYLVGAFYKSRLVVQFVSLMILGVGALILRDIGRVVLTYLGTFRERAGRNQT